MIKGIYEAGRSLDGKMKSMEIIANNLANVNTTGFKRGIPFSEVINQYGDVQVKSVTDYQQGNSVETKNPLDLYLNGNGLFAVQTANGVELTRNGKFTISEDGYLTDENGNHVLGKNGEINLDGKMFGNNKSITIAKDGEIKVGDTPVDKLLITKLDKSRDIEKVDGSHLVYKDGPFEELPDNEYEIQQGYLEESNSNPITELETMIKISNDYQTNQKMVQFLDESLGQANEIGKV